MRPGFLEKAGPRIADARVDVAAGLLEVDVLRPEVERLVALIARREVDKRYPVWKEFLNPKWFVFPGWHLKVTSGKDMMSVPNLVVAGPGVART